MKIYLASAGLPPEHSAAPIYATQLAGQRSPRRHRQVDDPDNADVVLFTDCHVLSSADWTLRAITSAEVARRFPSKVCVHNERDRPWCRLPGVYVSMPAAGFVPQWQVAGAYFCLDPPRTPLGLDDATVEPDLLFSFIGTATHACRQDIFRLRTPRSYVERTHGFLLHDRTSGRFDELRTRFAESMLRSNFVLCPRGHSTSSFRLYETLSAGRVPVIIADAWVPPAGPRWDEFSIRWPEALISQLPDYLAEQEPKAAAMGTRAREAYTEWFARDVVLTHQLDQLAQLMGPDAFGAFPSGGYKNQQYFRTLRGAMTAHAKQMRGSLFRRRTSSTQRR